MSFPYYPIPKEDLKKCTGLLKSSDSGEFQQWEEIYNRYRANHIHALNSFRVNLMWRIDRMRLSYKPLVAQRFKRLASVIKKMENKPHITLEKMQDIWWIRVVLESIGDVKKLRDSYAKKNWQDQPFRIDDYIFDRPRESWYRSTHIKFTTQYKDKESQKYNWLKLELQIRTKLQHSWATAVEILTELNDEWLKSWKWEKENIEFFQYVSKCFEQMEFWYNIDKALIKKMKDLDTRHKIIRTLSWCKEFIKVETSRSKIKQYDYVLLTLLIDFSQKTWLWNKKEPKWNLTFKYYKEKEYESALRKVREQEDMITNNKNFQWNVVLVRTDQIRNLKKQYPNYYLDADLFVEEVKKLYDMI